MSYVACSAALLEAHFIGRQRKVGNHSLKVLAVYSYGLANVVLREIWIVFLSRHWTRLVSNGVGAIVPNSKILFVHKHLHGKINLITEDDFSMEIRVSVQPPRRPFSQIRLNKWHLI